MKLATFEVNNFRGIEHILVKPGAMTIVSGTNGSGKTSLIEALRTIFDGGHHPSNVRKGERKAEIILTLDTGIVITKTVTAKTSTLTVTDAEGQELPDATPKAFVERLATGFSFDPLGLIQAKPKDRAAFILESMPVTFTPTEIAAADPEYKGGVLDLDGLSDLHKGIYEKRKAANVIQRDTEGTVKTLQAALGTQEGETKDWESELRDLQAERATVDCQLADAEKAIIASATKEEHAVINEINEKISKLAEERATRVASIKAREAEALKHNEDAAKPERERIAGELAVAQEKVKAQSRDKATRASIEAARAKVREYFQKSDKFDKSLRALEELKKKKLAEQPLEGIELRDGEVFVDGIPFDELNTARQYLTAFSVAALKCGDLGLMIADRCEALESDTTWKAFVDGAKESGFQIVATRVEPGPLRVEVA